MKIKLKRFINLFKAQEHLYFMCRYHDSRHNSPGRGGGGPRGYYEPTRTHYDSGRPQYDGLRSHYDPSRTLPNRYQNQFVRQRTDSYGSPGRGGVNIRSYEVKFFMAGHTMIIYNKIEPFFIAVFVMVILSFMLCPNSVNFVVI